MGLDYYSLLELTRQATDADIKKAYRKLSLKFHPKRSADGSPSSEQEFSRVAEAYDVLSCLQTKALYDQYGEEGIKGGVPLPPGPFEAVGPVEIYAFHGDPMKVFRDFFGVDNPFADYYLPNVDPSYKFFEQPAKPRNGPVTEQAFPLSLEEAFYGCVKTLKLPVKVLDETGSSTVDAVRRFTFTVPAGCSSGKQFHFSKCGHEGLNMLPGDVTFVAQFRPHPDFTLEDRDLVVKRTITFSQALTGCVVDVATLDGKVFHVPMTDVVRHGLRVRLAGEGMPFENSDDRGDLIVEFNVKFPEKINKADRLLIKKVFVKDVASTA